MKQILQKLMIFISLITVSNYAQTFQEDLLVPGQHIIDLNTVELQDTTNDYIVAGSLLDTASQTQLTLTRIDDATGNIVWHKVYNNPQLRNFRGFDIISYSEGGIEGIAVTGSVNVNAAGTNSTYVAKIDASTGAFIAGKHYQIPGNLDNSQGMHIIYTNQVINNTPTPGFVIGGFVNNAYTTSISGNNTGFVLRVDLNLSQSWVRLLEGNLNTSNDYDIVNNITEVNGGYFITGSTSGLVSSFPNQKGGVLATKLDNNGTQVWNSSYVFGNAYDVGADAYYDASTDEIYLLANYSVSHHFGVTVLNNTTGVVNFSKSWYATSQDLNKYAFKINKTNNQNQLAISGYVRDTTIPDQNGGVISAQTTPFVLVFDKNTGNQILSFQYQVPYVNPAINNGFFSFWNGQMPFAYYPDISLTTNTSYFHVAYRTRVTGFSEMELIKTNITDFKNDCELIELQFTPNPINILPTAIKVNPTHIIENTFVFNVVTQDYELDSCDKNDGDPNDEGDFCCSIDGNKNLIQNGNFEFGNTGFLSSYTQTASTFPGEYDVTTSAGNFAANVTDHSFCSDPVLYAANDQFLVVNGRTQQSGYAIIWKQNVTGLEVGKEYKMCANFKDMEQCTFNIFPKIRMSVPGSTIIQTINTDDSNPCDWERLELCFTATSTTVNLVIEIDESGNGDGNDVAIDDIALQEKLDPGYSITVQHQGSNNAIIGSLNSITTTDDILLNTECDLPHDYYWFVFETTTPLTPFGGIVWSSFEWSSNVVSSVGPIWNLTTNFPNYNFANNKFYVIGLYIPSCCESCYTDSWNYQVTYNFKTLQLNPGLTEEMKQEIIDHFVLTGDGSRRSSETESPLNLIKLYPNPAYNTLNIDVQNETIQKVVINSVTGQTVYSKNDNSSNIDISNLSNGLYMVTVYGENQKRFTSKFIKK